MERDFQGFVRGPGGGPERLLRRDVGDDPEIGVLEDALQHRLGWFGLKESAIPFPLYRKETAIFKLGGGEWLEAEGESPRAALVVNLQQHVVHAPLEVDGHAVLVETNRAAAPEG